jgi:hypothetical protein
MEYTIASRWKGTAHTCRLRKVGRASDARTHPFAERVMPAVAPAQSTRFHLSIARPPRTCSADSLIQAYLAPCNSLLAWKFRPLQRLYPFPQHHLPPHPTRNAYRPLPHLQSGPGLGARGGSRETRIRRRATDLWGKPGPDGAWKGSISGTGCATIRRTCPHGPSNHACDHPNSRKTPTFSCFLRERSPPTPLPVRHAPSRFGVFSVRDHPGHFLAGLTSILTREHSR